jgi:glycosyltransferase involved in cell wall biosynthesis
MLSFIVPAYNEELELPGALRAIQNAAGNHPFEMIVVDDSSSDRTAMIAHEHGASVVSIQRRHIAAARNAGARVAMGNVFFFVDADTRIEPAHVTDALDALRKGASGGGAWLRFDRKVPFWADVIFRMFSVIYFSSGLAAGAFLFTTRDNFFAAGGFDEKLFAGEETYLSVALKKMGRFRILHTPATTSARKLRMHRPGYVFRRFLTIVFSGPRVLRSRKKLDLWYDGKREQASI